MASYSRLIKHVLLDGSYSVSIFIFVERSDNSSR